MMIPNPAEPEPKRKTALDRITWIKKTWKAKMYHDDLLIVDNVSYDPEGPGLLKDISFTIKRGENLVIFGPENSGIALICSIISGLIKDFEGEIYFKGNAIKKFDFVEIHNYRKDLGYLQSDYGLINNMSVEENITLPLSYHSKRSAKEISEVVDSLISELNLKHCRTLRPVNLLRSEQLKAAFARAVALEPDLLLLEHSLEGICLLNAQTFLNSVEKRSLYEGKSMVVITYEPDRYFNYSDRFIMFDNGSIVFSGTKEEFIRPENRYLDQYMKSSVQGPMMIL